MEIIELSRNLCFLKFATGHAYLWHDTDDITLIDTGIPGSAPLVSDAIRTLGYRPSDLRRLVLTHFHVDHTGAAAEISKWGNVEVLAHKNDVPFIQGDEQGPPPNLLDWERPLYEKVSVQIEAQPVKVDRILDDGDVLDFGGGARIIAVPGHTPGSIAIHLPATHTLFTGDAIARMPDGQVILGVFNCNPAQAAASFCRLADLNPVIVCFGHGDPLIEQTAAQLKKAADMTEKGVRQRRKTGFGHPPTNKSHYGFAVALIH